MADELRFQVIEDPMEREDWEDFQKAYPRAATALSTNMWNFVREHYKVSPKKVGKKKMTKLFSDMSQSKSVKDRVKLTLKEYDKGRLLGRQAGFARDVDKHGIRRTPGEVSSMRKKQAWNRGLYEHIATLHESHTKKGVPYARSYRRWDTNQLKVLRSKKSLEVKADLLNRSEASVRRKMSRL